MKPTYRRFLVLALCLSLASIVLPVIVTVSYYWFALKREVHPDGGPGFVHFLFMALEATLPVGRIAVVFIVIGVFGFIASVILLLANVLVGKTGSAAKTEEIATATR
jgi:hypothetical protein